MIYLILAILFNALIIVIFKLFARYQVDALPAIVLNYFVCFLTGLAVTGGTLIQGLPHQATWFESAIFLSLFFIVGFNVVAATVRFFGIGIATIMQKMSLIFVVLAAVGFLGEALTVLKVAGLTLAILSVILINWPNRSLQNRHIGGILLLPIATLLVSGVIDVTFVVITKRGIASGGDIHFVAYLFLFAGILGLIPLIVQRVRGELKLGKKEWIAGILLGVPNFFSVYFIMHMLDIGWDGSIIFPINNIGILVVSVLIGLILFGEKLSRLKQIGFVLSVVAIIILAYTQMS